MAQKSINYHVLIEGRPMLSGTCFAALTVGPQPTDTICTSAMDDSLELLRPYGDGYAIHLGPGLVGRLRSGGRTLRVAEGLLLDPRPEPLLFRDGDRGVLQLDPRHQLRFSIHQQRQRFSPRIRPDLGLSVCLGISGVIATTIAVLVSAFPPPEKPSEVTRLRELPALARRTFIRHKVTKPLPHKRGGKKPKALANRTAPPSMKRRFKTKGRAHRQTRPVARRTLRRLNRHIGKMASSIRSLSHLANIQTSGSLDTAKAIRALSALEAPAPRATTPRFELRRSSRAPRKLLRAPRPTNMSRQRIRRVVAKHRGEIRLCYERQLLTTGRQLSGRIVMRWFIDAAGRTTGVRALSNSTRSKPLEHCIARGIGNWKFPGCAGGQCEVVYPFEFFTRI